MQRNAGPFIVIALLLLLGGGFAWLTHHPEAEIVERGEKWPLVGPLFSAFRERWAPTPTAGAGTKAGLKAGLEDDAPRVEIVVVEPELPPMGDGIVWVMPGTRVHSEPSASSPTLFEFDAIANVTRLERRGDWFRVWRRGTEGWLYLEDYADDDQPPYGRAVEPPLPLPGLAPTPAALADARQGLNAGGRELGAGPYRLYTDVDDAPLLAALDALASGLETAYTERYGRKPIDEARAAVVLYASELSYRRLQSASARLAGLHSGGHARAGMVALYAGSRSRREIVNTLAHELTHLVNRRALGPALPSWLDEGLADDLAHATVADADATAALRDALHDGRLPKVERVLGLAWEDFVRPPRGPLNYAVAAAWVRYLLEGENGRRAAAFRAFLAAVAAGEPATPERLRQELGASWRQLDAGFRAWVEFGASPAS